ncbi:MAG: right-handed parallel beta-helix repeat-containing protein, partial [Thermoplasmata archaeon]|nr:right-handed parallel beta-helix repeat-containing protein [Thermoplasmata archaeon]
MPLTICYSSNISVADNTISNTQYGIEAQSTTDLRIIRNNFTRAFHFGVNLRSDIRTVVSENDFYNNDYYGLYSSGSKELKVFDNLFSNNNWSAIGLSCNEAMIYNNHIQKSIYDGIQINAVAEKNRIFGNTISRNGRDGIHLFNNAKENLIYENNISYNTKSGVYLVFAENNKIFKNEFHGNKYFGIFVNETIESSIFQNEMYEDGIGYEKSNGFYLSNEKVVINNTLNGKPIRIYFGGYLIGDSVPKNTGQVVLLDVTCLKIEGIQFSNACVSIVTKNSPSLIIQDCTFQNNSICGILLTSSPYSQITRCNFSYNQVGIISNTFGGPEAGSGLFVFNEFYRNDHHGLTIKSHFNSIRNNEFKRNGISGIFCEWMQETIIVDNDFIMNQYGIILKYCYSNDQITKNLFYKNERYGIWTDSTDW